MCASNTERSKKYSDTRTSFKDLGMDEKAAFLVESTIEMVVKGVREAGDAASEALKNISVDFGNEEDDGSPGSSDTDDAGDQSDSNGKSAGKKKAAANGAKKNKKTGGTKKNSESQDGESS